MRFDAPLIRGTLIQRYKRFLADVEPDGGCPVTAHCPNSGSMMGMKEPGLPVLISQHDDPRRKLPYTWELVHTGDSWVGVNTARPNAIVHEALLENRIPELSGYTKIQREVKVGEHSRLDFKLEKGESPPCFVEVKSATLRQGEAALFPDAVTQRGKKHLLELADLVAAGRRGVIFFLVGREDCQRFEPAREIDPDYAQTLKTVVGAGVEVLAYACRVSPEEWTLDNPLPVLIDPL